MAEEVEWAPSEATVPPLRKPMSPITSTRIVITPNVQKEEQKQTNKKVVDCLKINLVTMSGYKHANPVSRHWMIPIL